MSKLVLTIDKMDCPTEEGLIRNRLGKVDGIDELQFNLMSRELTVTHSLPDPAVITQALDEIGLGPRETAAGVGDGHDHKDGDDHKGADDHAHEKGKGAWVVMGVAGACAAAAEVVAWRTDEESSIPVIALAVASLALAGRETLMKGLIALKTRTLNINFLMMVAVIGAGCIGQWPEAAMVTFLFAVAEMIEAYSLDRARNAIQSLMAMTPETAFVKVGEGYEERDATTVNVGDIVRVRPGDRIALDGTLVSGSSSVNQAPITGESVPVEKVVGDKVFAGTINEKGAFELTVTAQRGNTTLDRIVRAVQSAQGDRAPTQRFVDRFARVYTPTVLVIAIGVAALPPLLTGAEFLPWLYKALVLLVIACPCALVISTPVSVVSGLAAAAKNGVLVKGGVYLELAKDLRMVALDKTGTITHGKPVLTDVIPLGGSSREEVLTLAARVDAPSEHPVASAVVAGFVADSGGKPPGPVEGFQAIAGRGARGVVDGVVYFVGNHRLAEENKVCSLEVEAHLNRLEEEGKTTVVLSDERRALAVFAVADTLKPTSIEALRLLHVLGVKAVMLTGDNQRTATAIAKQVGLDDARGGLLPEDKLATVKELQQIYGVVGMVGDGINDAPALATANIGFAMGAAGTDTAIETADVALMDDDLRKLPFFVSLGRQTSAVLLQNIVLAIGIKVIFFGLALAGLATLWMAVFADMGASLLVVGNGLRLLRGPRASLAGMAAIVGVVAVGCAPVEAPLCEERVPLVDVSLFSPVAVGDDPYVTGDPAQFFADRTREGDERPRLCEAPREVGLNNLGGEPVFDVDTFNCNWATVEQPLLQDIEDAARIRVRVFYFSQLARFLSEGRNVITVGDQVVLDESVALPTESGLLGFEAPFPLAGTKGDRVVWHVANHGENSWNFIELSMVREIPCPLTDEAAEPPR
jgi:Cd2+/Zn2+-exporting ATPase